MEEWVKGPGGLLQEDQQLLFFVVGGVTAIGDDDEDEEQRKRQRRLLMLPPTEQRAWLDNVKFARCRAQAWDATHYAQERTGLKAWLKESWQKS